MFHEYLIENNAFKGDINEILVAYYCNKGSWDNFINSKIAKSTLKDRKSKISKEEFMNEKGRAVAMAASILEWLKNTKFGNIKQVEWVSRKSDIVTPADIVLYFDTSRKLGISAKSTNGSRDIVFRNPGLGSVDSSLKLDLKTLQQKEESKFIEKLSLSDSPIKRKEQIRNNEYVLKMANEERSKILEKIRNALFKKLSMMPKEKLRTHIIDFWMGMDAHQSPTYFPYIKVTGYGINKNYTASIVDPLKSEKLLATQTEKIELIKSGNETIGVKAGDMNVLRIRAKYGSVPLAAPIEFSVDPWSSVEDNK